MPEDHPIREAKETVEQAAGRAEDTTRKASAAIHGALEGVVEGLDRYDLARSGQESVHEAGEIARATGGELRSQGQTAEMQKARAKAAGAAGRVRDTAASAAESVRHTAEDVKERASAVAETGRRAREAPGLIGHELVEAGRAWANGVKSSLAAVAVMAFLGAITLVVLTIALVVGLNEIFGDPQGTFLVAAFYAVGAGVTYAIGRSARAKANEERRRRIGNAREEARHVTRPVKDAFGRGRSGI